MSDQDRISPYSINKEKYQFGDNWLIQGELVRRITNLRQELKG